MTQTIQTALTTQSASSASALTLGSLAVPNPSPSTDLAVRVTDLSHSFGGTSLRGPVLDGISFEVPRGSICGLLGPNGCGKTTLIRLLLGVHWRQAGSVEVLGLDPQSDPVEVRRRVGYVPQESDLDPSLTVTQTLELFHSIYREQWHPERVRPLLQRFRIPDQIVGNLSGGFRQRLLLVTALAIDPELLLLDEPTAGLDAVVRRDFAEMMVETMAEKERTLLLSSHLLGELERLIDHVVILRPEGTISMPLDELKQRLVRWIVTFPDTAPPLAGCPVPPVRQEIVRDTLRLAFWADNDAEQRLRAWLEAQGATGIASDEASLESIFVDLVDPSRGGR